MTTSFMELSPIEARQRVDSQAAILVDIREADEFVRSHIAGAHSHPLSQWETSRDTIDPSTDVIFMCRSGMRTASARDRLLANTTRPTFVLKGGIDAWSAAGLPTITDTKAPIEIMRQVQIAAGLLILAGVALGFLVATVWFGLAAFVGAGLLFAGISGFCGMAKIVKLAPWNRGTIGN